MRNYAGSNPGSIGYFITNFQFASYFIVSSVPYIFLYTSLLIKEMGVVITKHQSRQQIIFFNTQIIILYKIKILNFTLKNIIVYDLEIKTFGTTDTQLIYVKQIKTRKYDLVYLHNSKVVTCWVAFKFAVCIELKLRFCPAMFLQALRNYKSILYRKRLQKHSRTNLQ